MVCLSISAISGAFCKETEDPSQANPIRRGHRLLINSWRELSKSEIWVGASGAVVSPNLERTIGLRALRAATLG